MHAWLKRAVAGLLSAGTLLGGGLLTAGTANADEIRMPDIGKTITSLTASAATTYPREFVNGGFDYLPAGGWNVISPKLNTSRGKFTSVDPVNGQYIRNAHVTDGNVAWVKWDGFDASKFGWISDQKGGKPQGFVTDHANSVELQRDNDTDNTYAEIVGSEIGKSIYQKIDTQNSTDAVYTVRFDHAALSSEHADGMQALVNGKPVTMTRIGGNKAGDKTGWTGTDIVTHATNTDHYRHDGQWATYEGKVTIPANTPVSTFMFKSLNEAKPDKGNLIDNLTFKIAYRLSYDSNGGTKAKASQISSMTEGKASETDGKVKTVADDAAGSIPSNETAGAVKQAKSKTNGSVRLAADDDVAEYAANGLPDHLVNGDFEYPTADIMGKSDGRFWYISQNDNSWWANVKLTGKEKRFTLPAGFDKSKFAWHSTQTGNTQYPILERADDIQVDYKGDGTNHYSEITAAQAGSTLYQDVATTPGVMYRWSLKHASINSANIDRMSVMIGEPGKETAQEATRTTVNGNGDKTGKVGTEIATKVSNSASDGWNRVGQWETYTGTYIATSTVTRFAFRSIEGGGKTQGGAWDGNLLDDVQFTKAYKLSYDKNASDATGKVPSNQRGKENAVEPAESKTTGNVKTVADNTSNLPDHLVNGTFDYRGNEIINENQRVYGDTTYLAIISAKTGIIGNPLHSKLDNWDSGKFGWKSNDATAGADTVEVQRRNHTPYPTNAGNVWGEIAAAKQGKYIYQDIATTPGVVYKWSLKHASRNADQDDSMQVMIGEPGAEAVQEATRTTSNGTDKVGEKSTTITTHGTAQDGRWETYTGGYIATSTTTRFTFRSVRDSNGQGLDFTAEGNCVDDLSFDKAYRLGYDGNGGTGQVPSRTEAGKTETAASRMNGTVRLAADRDTEPESGTTTDDRKVLTDTIARQDDGTSQRTITRSDGSVRVETIATTGAVSGCQVYYPAGTRITLATAKIDSDCWDSSQISKTNRTFYGWSANTDANDRDVPVADTMDRNTLNANARTEIVMPARAKTVYALWAINPTLSYNVNAPAGSNAPGTPASQTVPYNTAAADKSGWAAGDTGKIPGYRFDGWYTAPNGGNKYDFNTPLTGNVTVYAHWIGNGYTVRFAGNGATGGNTPDQAFQYNIGQNLHRNGFVRDGYTFTGWKRADNQQAYGDGQWVTNLTTQPNGIVTMVAQWSANEAHIRYNPNPPAGKTAGGNGTPNWDGHTGDTPAIRGNGWTIDGYTFAGWTTNADGGGTKYAPGASWTASGTLTLYAQWTPGEAGLTYDGNGATGGKTDPQNGVTDQKVNVRQNGFTRDGYTFVTWNTQADCKGNAVKPNSEWTLRGSSTLYACWAGVAQTLTYHGNGATGGNTAAQSGHTGDELTTNANGFTRDGYTFVRWDTAKDGSGTAYGEGKNGVSQYVMKPAGNDLYAIWKANPATIQYRNDWPNTTGSTPDTTGNTGDTVTISQNSFDRPGYTFTGWSTSKRGDPSLQPGDKHTLEPRTTTVWAQWKADPAHLVYNSNIGTVGSETKTVDGVVDQTVKTITNPFDRPGYTFSGWNTQADGKGKAYATGADYVLTANDKSTPKNTSVLYAQWKINGASLKFNPNGGIGHVDDVTGDAFSTVTIPGDAKEPKITRPGYRFVGWSTEKNPPAGSTFLQPGEGKVTLPAEGSTTVYAQWEPSLTTLPFTGGQAQVPTIWLYAGFALMLIALGVMMPMLRMRMAATKRTGKHMPITGGKHAK